MAAQTNNTAAGLRRTLNLSRLSNLVEPDLPTSQTVIRGQVPRLSPVTTDFPTYYGANGALCFLALQLQRTTDKDLFIRALASAMSIIHKDRTNFTGSPTAVVDLTGLSGLVTMSPDELARPLTTNFLFAENVTGQEVRDLLEADLDEIAFFFGVMCLAGVKRLTDQNKSAFNENRAKAVRAACNGELKIFVPNSAFLTDEVLNRAYAAFNSRGAMRAHMITNCANKVSGLTNGLPAAFNTMFMLLVDQGMAAIKIIKEAIAKYPEIVDSFPEAWNEMYAVNNAIRVIASVNGPQRSFLKAIYGSSFVPLPYQETANILGICQRVMSEITPSYKNYSGGKISDQQEAKILRILNIDALGATNMHVQGDNATQMGAPTENQAQ